MRTTTLVIEGMHCAGCAATTEILLGRVPGVRKAEVSFGAGRARVLHGPEAREADLVAAVERAGFRAKAAAP